MANSTVPLEQRVLDETLRSLPESLPVLPLRGALVYPFATVPLSIGQERSVRLIDAIMRGNRLLLLVAQRRQQVEGAMPDDIHSVGTVGQVVHLLRDPEGGVMVAIQGLARVHI